MCDSDSYCGSPLEAHISLTDDGVFDSEMLQYGYGTGFRNLPDSFFSVLQHFTIDNWSIVLSNLIDSSTEPYWLICIMMVIFGNFFIMNLILAVIYHSFDETIERNTGQEYFTHNYLNANNVDSHMSVAQ